jgi:hypothetical protein
MGSMSSMSRIQDRCIRSRSYSRSIMDVIEMNNSVPNT